MVNKNKIKLQEFMKSTLIYALAQHYKS